jgi:hypothetical protein
LGKVKIDPSLAALLGENNSNKKKSNLSFQDHLNRILAKLNANANRHKMNFKMKSYDQDTKVSYFMSGREMRAMKELARQREQEFEIDVVPPSDTEDDTTRTKEERAAETKFRLK